MLLKLLAIAVLLTRFLCVSAQPASVLNGTVADASGFGLPGAAVIVVGPRV